MSAKKALNSGNRPTKSHPTVDRQHHTRNAKRRVEQMRTQTDEWRADQAENRQI